ncbi:antiviral reverse transcriptase Drt5 [Cupriavidus oxalaticus]|uniref:Reverse transcriptase domain-containing protein n=1 Tax=Cupriavidus oxalaticus TaxID=96344 RepID=A0A4P7LHC3_9BURK|nr:antiviral reverse transcriptase Drt5 [Cupriavidus oxalaticus]QBY55546.1 hypothetical protein E0W60_31545 [Cupriavidus oxalaticus]
MSATFDFMKADFTGTLFPMKTNLLVAEMHENEVSEYIYQKILSETHASDNFLSQQRVYATKPKGHLRRTVKLDPVAEYFIYDIAYRNRAIFRPEVSATRRSFGYRFKNGSHISVHSAYQEYKHCLIENGAKFKHNLQFDVASYFNSLYHHDIAHWFADKPTVSELDSGALGKFLREINAGRSVDFLPHGIYPSKMIGNEFLKLVDLSAQFKSSAIVRFMDDFTLFGDDPDILRQDFLKIQQLLGQFGLNVNPSKTVRNRNMGDVADTLSDLQKSLIEIVPVIQEHHHASGVDLIEVEGEVVNNLSADQINSLLNLLKDEALEESDAEQILFFLRSHSDSILELLPALLRRFPNLIKHIHSVASTVSEKADLATVLLKYVEDESFFLEYQLFWLACIVEDNLMGNGCYGDLLMKIYERTQDSRIARAKVLEIPEQGFGFKEIRSEFLKTGQSDWLSWASAMGTRSLKAAERNYVLDYFSKGSPLNYLIAGCAKKF